MILTRNNKFLMVLIAVASLILGIAVVVPYKTVFQHPDILKLEIVLKIIIFPILVCLLSIYPLVLRYRQVRALREQSRIVSVMAYLPLAVFVGSLIINALYMLTKGTQPLGQVTWAIWFVVLLASLLALLTLFKYFTNFEMQLGVTEHATLDICVAIIAVCFGMIYYQIIYNYDVIMKIQGNTGDMYLFICYLVTVVILGFIIRALVNLIHDDELVVCVQLADLEGKSEPVQVAEYNRAYDDLLYIFQERLTHQYENFEEFQAELTALRDKEISEMKVTEETVLVEVKEETTSEEVEEETALEEVEEETALEEVKEETALEETNEEKVPEEVVEVVVKKTVIKEVIAPVVREVIKVEHVTEERLIGVDEDLLAQLADEEKAVQEKVEKLVADEEKLSELREEVASLEQQFAEKEAIRLEAERIKEEKRLQKEMENNKPKEIVPSFEDLVAFAKENPEIIVNEYPERKQVRLAIKRRVFLIMNDYPRDYRIAFYADANKLAEWYPQCLTLKARNNKHDNWFKFTNKGELTTEFLHDIFNSSFNAMKNDMKQKSKGKKSETNEEQADSDDVAEVSAE